MYVLIQKVKSMWYGFSYGEHHFNSIEMEAGEELEAKVSVLFKGKNLLV